ncbi:hypothetical protein, partial [Klebsiella pneumoniae]|uniref:hypothetical protein n=1 Tax=Klebsiella pneumoniae TaxID=573 RepID=UPI001F20D915
MKAFTLTVLAAMFLTPVHAIPLKPVTTLQPTYPVQAAAKRIEGQCVSSHRYCNCLRTLKEGLPDVDAAY